MSFRNSATAALIALGAIPGAALAQDMSGMDMSDKPAQTQQQPAPASQHAMTGMNMPAGKSTAQMPPGTMDGMEMPSIPIMISR